MGKTARIDLIFKRKNHQSSNVDSSSPSNVDTLYNEVPLQKSPRLEPVVINSSTNDQGNSEHLSKKSESIDISCLERDPALRCPMNCIPQKHRDEVQCAYIKLGPYRHILNEYPSSGREKNPRRFSSSWLDMFPSWLEYSPSKDAVFCLPCYLFSKGPSSFITEGFRNWKKVNAGKDCAFLCHIGKGPNSAHKIAEQACKDLMSQKQHIDKMNDRKESFDIVKNRLRLTTSIDAVRWLTFQACAFRGNDESIDSKNRGNFLEMIKLLSSYNEKVSEVVLGNAPGNATYTSPQVQKEILRIFAKRVQNLIRKEIGEAKYCIIIDEAKDESKKEQMALVLRFVDQEGFIRERFFDLVHVSNTSALTLKSAIDKVLSHHNLAIENLRGQGYDGASNMRGEWNGLQALFLMDCHYAYYIHCMAHRLQLALVAASREVIPIHQFFSDLSLTINIIGASCKRHDELRAFQATEIMCLIEANEVKTGRGLNQLGSLQRAGDTRWGSHFGSIISLLKMFNPACMVLENIIKDGTTYVQRGEASAAYNSMTSFEFIFILHLMKELMGISNDLCQALQRQSQDILNAMNLVASTKDLIQKFREDGWVPLLEKVITFCKEHDIDVPNLNANYTLGRGRTRNREMVTVEHHYRRDVFIAAVDSQLQELNSRFNENTVKLLKLTSALDPTDGFKAYNSDAIYTLANEFYPNDFTEQEKEYLKYQLDHYYLDVSQDLELRNLSSIADLCQALKRTKRSRIFYLVDRLIRLILTLPVSTATTERAFSAMNIVKTRLRNKMEDEFLRDYMIVYIEKEIAEKLSTESIIDEFYSMKPRRSALK